MARRRVDTRHAQMTARALENEVANTRFLTINGGTYRVEKLRKVRLMQDGAEVIRQLLNRVDELERELGDEHAQQPRPVVEAGRGMEELREHARSGRDSLTAQELRDAVEIAGFTHGGHYGKEPGEVRLAITMAHSRIIEEAGHDADRDHEMGRPDVPFEERVAAIEQERRERNRRRHDEWVKGGRK